MEDFEETRRIAARIEPLVDVLDVRLFNATARFEGFPPESERLTWRLEVAPSVKYERGDDMFVIEGIFEIEIVPADPVLDPDMGTVATLQFNYSGLFSLDTSNGDPEPEELDAYAKAAGLVVLLPYAREFTQDMTSRMGLMPLTLGQLHPAQLKRPNLKRAEKRKVLR